MTLVKVFKYELIKIIVFLLLFALSIFYVDSMQEVYYTPHPKQHNNPKDTSAVKNS